MASSYALNHLWRVADAEATGALLILAKKLTFRPAGDEDEYLLVNWTATHEPHRFLPSR